MIVEAKGKAFMGFLDPEVMTISSISSSASFVVEYHTNAFQHYAKKRLVVFAHDVGGHFITVAIIPKSCILTP
jgi:amino-acid N-acetyltransferase